MFICQYKCRSSFTWLSLFLYTALWMSSREITLKNVWFLDYKWLNKTLLCYGLGSLIISFTSSDSLLLDSDSFMCLLLWFLASFFLISPPPSFSPSYQNLLIITLLGIDSSIFRSWIIQAFLPSSVINKSSLSFSQTRFVVIFLTIRHHFWLWETERQQKAAFPPSKSCCCLGFDYVNYSICKM